MSWWERLKHDQEQRQDVVLFWSVVTGLILLACACGICLFGWATLG